MSIYLYLLSYLTVGTLSLPIETDVNVGFGTNYTGYKVITTIPKTEVQVELLKKIQAAGEKMEDDECSLDWWSDPSHPNVSVSVMVSPLCLEDIIDGLQSAGLEYNVTREDMQEMIFKERAFRWETLMQRIGDNWNTGVYHNLAEIRDRVDHLVSSHSQYIEKVQLGTTFEGRSIDGLVIREPGSAVKPGIWLDCGIHAREWVSPPACLHAIDRLVQEVNSLDPRDNLLSAYDFYILPVANPDGYVYSWQSDRMWRKNRRPVGQSQSGSGQTGAGGWPGFGGGWGFGGGGWGGGGGLGGQSSSNPRCTHGVDPNRNFPALFSKGSTDPCSDSFKGAGPFSEAESKAIQKGVEMMKANSKNIAAFVSIHAYSQFWMSPYGYSYNTPSDYQDHMSVMKTAVDALESVHGTKFKYGPISDIIYVAYGSSVDWAYDYGIKYSFGLELRDTGNRGFLLPQDQIEATVEETWAGLKAMAWAIEPEFV